MRHERYFCRLCNRQLSTAEGRRENSSLMNTSEGMICYACYVQKEFEKRKPPATPEPARKPDRRARGSASSSASDPVGS